MATMYRGTSLIRNRCLLGLYSRTMSRATWWSKGGAQFLRSEAPLYSLPEIVFVARRLSYLTQSVLKVMVHKSVPTQIRGLILYISNEKG